MKNYNYLLLLSSSTRSTTSLAGPNALAFNFRSSLIPIRRNIISTPSTLVSERNILNAISKSNEEPRTGWLHNKEPKHYFSSSESNRTGNPARKLLQLEKMKKYRNHRMIHPPAFHPCGENKRMVVTEHKVAVPITYPDLEFIPQIKESSSEQKITTLDRIDNGFNNADSFEKPKLDVYFIIIELISTSTDELFFQSLNADDLTPQQRAQRYVQRCLPDSNTSNDSCTSSQIDPSRMMLYLQGGPGFGCAPPVSGLSLASSKSSWAAEVLLGGLLNLDGKKFERVLLMDQRGTGRSTPINKQRLQKMFPNLFLFDEPSDTNETSSLCQMNQSKFSDALVEATDYLTKFRADSIVRDAEWIKEALFHSSSKMDADSSSDNHFPQPFGAVLGQSFGGFCIMTYLSSITHPPKLCLLTGGIAPMDTPVREVYDRLWKRVRERNWRYYEQYPGDIAVVKRIVRYLLAEKVILPSGGILTARRFLQLGLNLGSSPGSSFSNMHSLVNSAFIDELDDTISLGFLKRMDYEQSFDNAPLYFLLHESIYADGPSSKATDWAAQASYEAYIKSTMPEFDYVQIANSQDKTPILFFGEMVFTWMADGDYAELSGHGMKRLSESLAKKNDWLPLFDERNMRAALVGNGTIPPVSKASASVYYEDMYVDFDCCMKLVQRGKPLEGLKVWITNEYQHSGLRDDGANIVRKLLHMAKGSSYTPS